MDPSGLIYSTLLTVGCLSVTYMRVGPHAHACVSVWVSRVGSAVTRGKCFGPSCQQIVISAVQVHDREYVRRADTFTVFRLFPVKLLVSLRFSSCPPVEL